ncbi:hypothetical protein GH714_005937 [Hevea brasiliensis]|uniref:non-specific serine/threonine protein kinase n=1 Tax=Hevea brasiliensis TaxID=3981 RepID=A0A6A6LEP0_HEVBR|nr:hypothetical protein GH714_005937 [Hevea brasiliensis]
MSWIASHGIGDSGLGYALNQKGYATDWWSVGVILFELVTGIPPFTAERPEIIFDNILNRKIPWPPVPNSMSYEAQDLINSVNMADGP